MDNSRFFQQDRKDRILLDIGSSTVKAYDASSEEVKLLVARSIPFKKDFDPEGGISESNKKELFEFVEAIKEQNQGKVIKIYATAVFRKLTANARIAFVDEFFSRTGLCFNIVGQDLESFYLETALAGKCDLKEPVLLINIGGGSTELVVMYGKEAVERHGLDFGVGTINEKFPTINESLAGIPIRDVINFVEGRLPVLNNSVKVAFYSGGELTYMKLAAYPLEKNILFKDRDHPAIITMREFVKKNREVFEKIDLFKLESLMPENPTWMYGARGCSAIAQAICEKYGIETIIPSDSNIVNGVIRQEFREVTISGSFRKHLNYILGIKKRVRGARSRDFKPTLCGA